MRSFIFILAWLLATPALAQTAPQVSGYWLGMSVAQARAVNPELRWGNTERAVFGVEDYAFNLGGVRMAMGLVFVDGALDYIGAGGYESVSSDGCATRMRSVVEALEGTIGALADGAQNPTPGNLEPISTAGGSFIRRSAFPEGVAADASMAAPVAAQVSAWSYQISEQWECSIWIGVSAAAPLPADLPQSTIANWVWLQTADSSRFFPRVAMEHSRGGVATLICTVGDNGALACTVAHESAEGWGFGAAALRVMAGFRMAPQTRDGVPTAGATIRQTVRFAPSY